MTEWNIIDTAPRDGTPFVGRLKHSGLMRVTWWGKVSHIPLDAWCFGEDPEDIDCWFPEFWAPLPEGEPE